MTPGSLLKRGLISTLSFLDDIFPFFKILVLLPIVSAMYFGYCLMGWIIYMITEIKEEWNRPNNGGLP